MSYDHKARKKKSKTNAKNYMKKVKQARRKDVKYMTVTVDKEKQVKQITIPQDGSDDIVIKTENVDITPDKKYMLPQFIIDSLGLKMVWRPIGNMLILKIPIFENEPQDIIVQDELDEHPIKIGTQPKIYIARYDLVHDGANNWNMIEKNLWCLFMEKEIAGKQWKAGLFISNEMIHDISFVKHSIKTLSNSISKRGN